MDRIFTNTLLPQSSQGTEATHGTRARLQEVAVSFHVFEKHIRQSRSDAPAEVVAHIDRKVGDSEIRSIFDVRRRFPQNRNGRLDETHTRLMKHNSRKECASNLRLCCSIGDLV